MGWPDFETFLAIAREGQLTRAADTLGTSVPTLHRRIAALETALGTKLFVRGNTGHRLTEAGERLLASAQSVEAAMDGFRSIAATVRIVPEGRVRIAAPDLIVLHLLGPRVDALRHMAPGVMPEFIVSPDRTKLTERQADIAVRLSDPGENSLIARRIGSASFGLYAPDAATAVHEIRRDQNGWLRVPWVGWNEDLAGLPAARCLVELLRAEDKVGAANAVPHQLILARALGAAVLLPDFLARHEAGLLRVAAAPSPVLKTPIWLVVNQEVRGSPFAEIVTSWIEDTLAEFR